MDYLFGLLVVGGGPIVLGIVFGAIFASNARRTVVLAVTGLLVLVVLLAVLILVSPPTSEEQCHECEELFGRWFQPVIFFWALLNFFAWTIGVLVGGIARAAVKRNAAPAG